MRFDQLLRQAIMSLGVHYLINTDACLRMYSLTVQSVFEPWEVDAIRPLVSNHMKPSRSLGSPTLVALQDSCRMLPCQREAPSKA